MSKIDYLLNDARKFLLALLAALAILAAALSDGAVSTSEWIQIAVAFGGALLVHEVSNQPSQ